MSPFNENEIAFDEELFFREQEFITRMDQEEFADYCEEQRRGPYVEDESLYIGLRDFNDTDGF